MIITAKNIDTLLDKPHYIVIPRASLLQTFIFHTLILNIACVLLYGAWAYVGIPMLLASLLLQIFVLRKAWIMVGYSQRVFISIIAINTIANLLLAIPERQIIADMIISAFMS